MTLLLINVFELSEKRHDGKVTYIKHSIDESQIKQCHIPNMFFKISVI